MIRVLFICHGNICRSPMAEFVFKDLIKKRHVDDLFFVASAATSTEEIGNPVHYGTRNKLASLGISTAGKYAVQLRRSDYDKYDYLIGMEQRNVANMRRIAGGDPEGKMYNLLDFTGHPRDIADPWYTGDFDATYDDILEGCTALLDQLLASQEQTILTL
ncbi:MAG: low molecular weight protein-tyrosine-phosphatase [Lachnospiraceae bacterium]|nr:low molecular weight protein-tyrosine-phosphatase [Lachnospiraceae bacterium]